MYVYYETWQFGSSFYTHRVTVYERCTDKLFQTLKSKFGSKSVNRTKGSGKVYVRETMRIARVHRNMPRTPATKRYGEWLFATSRNFVLGISAEFHPDSGEKLSTRECN
ncbi:hypothetical protein HOT32_gp16 [Erwinia phage Faunus]|uniref:Uncharacterized protein n=1 Tax=Erwinia phage Faunus TaxID=2182346 RepID=A0A2U8UWH0_9CAUD|nr:hypothetical protein HOT32_gp16 [Erwinia phage Faunus]AWN08599.1 hypothetical protein [Erwinia phage Faunus]